MKMEFKNSIRKVRFSCYLTDNKIAWINPWGVQLVCMKVQTHSKLTVTTGIQSGPDAFDESPSWELWKYTVSDWFKKEK